MPGLEIDDEPESVDSPTKRRILGLVIDAVADLMYYERKEDEDTPRGAIETAIKDGVITVDDMVSSFRAELES